MIIVNFDRNELCKKAYGLWQYDYGQVLRIQGLNLPTAAEIHFALQETLNLPTAAEIHFALQETGGEAVTRIGVTKDGVTDVTIPDSLLEADGTSQDYQIYVFVYLTTPDSGETTRKITLGVKSRPRPEAFEAPGDGELFKEAIQAVNDAAKRAEDAGKEATAAAGEARESASLARKHLTDTQALAEQVEINADTVAQGAEKAKELLAQTQEVASNAVISAQAAKQAEMAAREAQTAAESAEDAARQYAAGIEADRQEVADGKQSVAQMQSNVARMQADVQADREAVEQTVSEFGQTAENALEAVGQAQNAAVLVVQTEGQKQATAVQEAGAQAVNEVESAKTAAQAAVTAEGDKQVVRVQEAAAEIVADREQINQNQTDIAAMTDKTNTLAPGIVLGAKGEQIAVSNASEQPFVGLKVYGKSTQEVEPSIDSPQEIVNAGGDGKIEAQISGKNLLTGQMYYSNYSKGIAYIESFTNEVVLPYMPLVCTQGICYVFPCVSGKTYTFSVTNPNPNLTVRISEYKCLNDTSAYSKAIGYTNSPNINTFNTYTAKGNGVIVCALGGVWSSENPLIHKCTESELLQLEIGSAATSYEAYKQLQTLTLATPDGLPGIPVKSGGNYTDEKGQQWICDEIDLGRGKYVQRIKEVIINQDTKISTTLGNYGALEKDSILTRYLDRQIKKNGSVLCRELPCAPNWNYENESVYTTETSIDFRFSRQRLGLGTETTAEENKIAVLKFLETTPLHCLVELNDPIERVLTPEEIAAYKSLHTYSPNTTVVNNAGAGMAVEYVADTKTYIKSVEDKITAIQAALISQNISGGYNSR